MAGRSLGDWLDYVEALHPSTIDMGLERVRRVALRMDLVPQVAPRTAIIAGTNGKGSTAAALEALGCAHGLSVGTTLSPHVHRFNERVRINGRDLDDATLCVCFAQVEAGRGEVPLTYFEFATLVALQAFKAAGVDIAILEVGLGGRLDAFNIIDADVAIITSIGLDHVDYLGDDLEQIGREKAGVLRRGQSVVLGTVTRSVREAATRLGCETRQLGIDFQVEEAERTWSFRSPVGDFPNLPRGSLAAVNCALALAALPALLASPGQPDAAKVAAALRDACLTGRMEHHRYRDRDVVLDVAHNPPGAAFLAAQLRERYPGRRFVAVFAALADKDAQAMVREPGEQITDWLTVSAAGARGRSAEELARALAGAVSATPFEDLRTALDHALSLTPRDGGIVVFGSFSVVEQAREVLLKSSLDVVRDSTQRETLMDTARDADG